MEHCHPEGWPRVEPYWSYASYALKMSFGRAMPRKRPIREPKSGGRRQAAGRHIEHDLRIVGGRFRGSKLIGTPDLRVRPMKDRVREAVFNLIGPRVMGKHAFDLFAGTGALALEALSRGAARATLVECHFPTVDAIARNVQALGVEDQTEIVRADTFYWVEHEMGRPPTSWLVMCSPPFDFYVQRHAEMLALIQRMMEMAPDESIMVVESDERFEFSELPRDGEWDVRRYPPAVVGVWLKNPD